MAISSLSWSTTEQRLLSVFSYIGKVLNVTIIKNHLGESVGSAYITMSNKSDADTAVRTINGKVVDGKVIRVWPSPQKEQNLIKALLSDS